MFDMISTFLMVIEYFYDFYVKYLDTGTTISRKLRKSRIFFGLFGHKLKKPYRPKGFKMSQFVQKSSFEDKDFSPYENLIIENLDN